MRTILQYPLGCILALTLLATLPAHAAPSPQAVASTQQEQLYSGNNDSRIYHNSGCRYFTCKKCTLRFSSSEEARAQGFKACKVCGG